MATVKGVNRTKLDTPNSGNIIPEGQNHGNLKVIFDSYELSSTASGDIIQLGDLIPEGAAIMDVVIANDALGASTTIKVGDSNDDDRYLAAYSTSSAARKSLQADGVIDSIGYRIGTNSGDNQLIATLGGGTGTGTLYAIVVYSL